MWHFSECITTTQIINQTTTQNEGKEENPQFRTYTGKHKSPMLENTIFSYGIN